MEGKNANNFIDKNRYNYLKNKLLTHSPTELSMREGISVSTGYKIMASKNYDDYKSRQQEERRKAYEKRKGISPTPIKKNIPPLGNGQFRFVNNGTINGTKQVPAHDPNERVFGSPFRKEGDNEPRVIVPPYQSQTVVDVKSGSQLLKPDKRVDDFRQLNNLISIKKDGVDAYQFVDRQKLVSNRRLPEFFKNEDVSKIAQMMRNGCLDSEVIMWIKDKLNRHMTMEAVFRVAAFDEWQLKELKQAFKDGLEKKKERRAAARSEGGRIRGRANNGKDKPTSLPSGPESKNDTTKVEPKSTEVRVVQRDTTVEPAQHEAKGVRKNTETMTNSLSIPAGDKKITINFTITIE